MFKKFIAVVLTAAAVAGVGGCKKDETAGGTVPTITWISFGENYKDMKLVLEEANKIIEPAIGARLDMQNIEGSAYEERMKMYMASGNDFDICFTSTWLNDYHKAAQNGGILDITDYVDEYAPDLKTVLPDYVLQSAMINERLYGIPNVQVMTHPRALVALEEYVDKYNFDFKSVKHINDVEPFLEILKKNESDKYPFRPNNIDEWVLLKWEFVLEGSNVVIMKDGSTSKLELQFDTDEFKDGLKKMREWYEKGYIRADVSTIGDDTSDKKANKYVVTCDNWKPGGDAYDIVPKTYAILYEPYLKRNGALQTVLSVGAKSKHPDKAVQLIELMNTDKELYNLMCFGIEGVHYNLVDGKVKKIENSGYSPNHDWAFGNQFNAYVAEGQDDDIWEQTQKMNDEAQRSPLLGFVPDLTPIINELSQISAVNEEYAVYKVGADDPANYWEDYMKKLDIAGQHKVLEELQRQVDEFFSSK